VVELWQDFGRIYIHFRSKMFQNVTAYVGLKFCYPLLFIVFKVSQCKPICAMALQRSGVRLPSSPPEYLLRVFLKINKHRKT
jgi:hypothetical protein